MTDYLRPKVRTNNLGRRTMEDGIFKNPPLFTQLGGFTSERKMTDPSGRRNSISRPSLEKGGPSAQRGKPI
jgi:hypothetical protein